MSRRIPRARSRGIAYRKGVFWVAFPTGILLIPRETLEASAFRPAGSKEFGPPDVLGPYEFREDDQRFLIAMTICHTLPETAA